MNLNVYCTSTASVDVNRESPLVEVTLTAGGICMSVRHSKIYVQNMCKTAAADNLQHTNNLSARFPLALYST